jgi:hypothetical protein
MKALLVFTLMITFSLSSQAKGKTINPLVQEAITSKNEVLSYFKCLNKKSAHEIKCKMIKRHLKRDSKNCAINPNKISNLLSLFAENNRTKSNPVRVKGSTRYLGFFPGKYSYNVFLNSLGLIEIDTNIHFKNTSDYSDEQKLVFSYKMFTAAARWMRYTPTNYPQLAFNFNIAQDKKAAHIRGVKLLNERSRGPYFRNWSLLWSYKTISHEFGHVLGLDDEYKNSPFGGNSNECDANSIMCRSSAGSPMEYHYYMILRRAICQM